MLAHLIHLDAQDAFIGLRSTAEMSRKLRNKAVVNPFEPPIVHFRNQREGLL